MHSVLSGQALWGIDEGHVVDLLRSLPDGCVQCCVTSPPYWGLRAYPGPSQVWGGDADHAHEWQARRWYAERSASGGSAAVFTSAGPENAARVRTARWREDAVCACGAWRGALGQEMDVTEYVDHLVAIFREVRRVLHPTGTLWLNLGSSYAGSGRGAWKNKTDQKEVYVPDPGELATTGWVPPGFKRKDLVPVPWLAGLALQADGWWLRSDIVWQKPNALPSSVADRPTPDHEYVLLLTKRRSYFYDTLAVRRPASPASLRRVEQPGFAAQAGGRKDRSRFDVDTHRSSRRALENFARNPGSNLRTTWSIATEPLKAAHFAAFPRRLPDLCIRAGTPERGVCPSCQTPWRRVVTREKDGPPQAGKRDVGGRSDGLTIPATAGGLRVDVVDPTGWAAACDHGGDPVPALVLDPFVGSGTSGVAARRLFRRFLGFDVSSEYAALARRRIAGEAPWFDAPSGAAS